MSLSKLVKEYKGTIVVYCENFGDKCDLMHWCNEIKEDDFKEQYFSSYESHPYVKIRVKDNTILTFLNQTTSDFEGKAITFKEFCTKWVDKPINSSINDNYELI